MTATNYLVNNYKQRTKTFPGITNPLSGRHNMYSPSINDFYFQTQ